MSKIEPIGVIFTGDYYMFDPADRSVEYEGDVYSKDQFDTLTSELEACRKDKEEAIRLLSTTVDYDDNGVVVINEVAINNFLKIHNAPQKCNHIPSGVSRALPCKKCGELS